MASSSRARAVAIAALVACSAERDLPPPAPATIDPAIGYGAFDVPVTIRGAGFHVRAEQSVEGPAGTRVLAGFRAWLGDTELVEVVRVDEGTIAATVPAGIRGGSHALVVEGPWGRGSVPDAYVALAGTPPVLRATAAPVRDTVTVGDDAILEVAVTNVGPGAMTEVAPNVKRVVDGTRRVPLPSQAPVALAEGDSFTWRYGVSALEPGTLVYEAKAAGVEVITGAAVASPKVDVTIHVQTPPALSVVAALGGATVTVGEAVEATLVVTNAGTAAARVVPSATATGTASFAGALALPEILVPGGATVGPLSFSLLAAGAGTAEVVLSVAGVDVNSGREVSAASPAGTLVVLPPPVLRAALRASGPDPAAPAVIPVGAAVTLTMTVENVGEGPARNVRPGAVVFEAGDAAARGPAASATPPFDLAPGAVGTIVWTFDGLQAGAFAVTCTAEADAGASATASTGGAISAEVAVLAWDPLGPPGGAPTTAALVAVLGGDVVVGPDRTGTRVARVSPGGDALGALGLGVATDDVGPNVSSNGGGLEGAYPTLGAPGCARDGVPRTCGPDGELGPGLLGGVALGGEEWLLYGGARDGGLDYVYLAPKSAAALSFAHVDLSAVLPASTEALSAALATGDRLYLGFAAPDRPALVTLRRLPGPAGLDATATDATDLGLAAALASLDLPVPAAAGRLATVDALQSFGGRLYVFGSFGCLVAADAAPGGPAAFASCTRPSAKAAIAPPDARAIRPGQRAYPQVTVWGGHLVAARNTSDGPQLLACARAGGADPQGCGPGDWRLVAPNAEDVLDAALTQLDDPANHRIALLLATERYLYVGYEGSAGLRVYRTASTTLAGRVALTGAGGAPARPGTAGLGGDGLGLGATRVYGAVAVPDPRSGSSSPVLLVGDGAGPVRLVRLLE